MSRDPASQKITRVAFSCAGPEYWQFLVSQNRETVPALYREFVGPEVGMDDIFPHGGGYDPRNRFDISKYAESMHLVQRNNTLNAEIVIVAAATITREIQGRLLTGEQELIDCGQYGTPTRNSDPHIGGEINALARQKADVTLANPIGLYIAGLSTAGWSTPDGSDPLGYWTIVRGAPDKALRAVYEVPPGKGFVVGDIAIGGRPIEFGGQIADFIHIKVTGLACRFGLSTVAPMTPCFGQPPVPLAFPRPIPRRSRTLSSRRTDADVPAGAGGACQSPSIGSSRPSRSTNSICRRSRCSSAASSSSVGRCSLYREAKIWVFPSGSA